MSNVSSFLMTVLCSILLLCTPVFNAQNTDSDLLGLVNSLRSSLGAQSLCFSNILNNAAKIHSDDMARSGVMDHTGTDRSSPFDRMRKAGYTGNAVAENIAFGLNNVANIFQMWRDSPGHLRNMVNPNFNEIGIARSTSTCPNGRGQCTYWTQNFGAGNPRSCNAPAPAPVPAVGRIVDAVRNFRPRPQTSRVDQQSPPPPQPPPPVAPPPVRTAIAVVNVSPPPVPRPVVNNVIPPGTTPPRQCRVRKRSTRK